LIEGGVSRRVSRLVGLRKRWPDSVYIAWAKRNEIAFPPDLEAAVTSLRCDFATRNIRTVHKLEDGG
jgi:hypothetical protein